MIARAGGAQRTLATVGVAVLFAFFGLASFGGVAATARGLWVEPLSAKEAGDYWDLERMRAAKPLELDRAPAAGQPSVAARRAGPRPSVPRGAWAGAFGADFVQVPDPTAPGFRVHGAIFLGLGIFGYGRCSGTAVRSPNRSVVVTAGHCLHGGGGRGRWLATQGVFVPAYRYGQRPFGVFPTRWIDTTRQWRATGSENFDVGAMVVGRNEAGESLGAAVGGARIAWDLKPNQTFDVYGYPAEAPFDGETLRVCRATPFLGHDSSSFAVPGPLNLAVACGATGGSSGGGWMIRGNMLNSVTDYGYFDLRSPNFGAYFGKEVARLYGRAAKVG